MLSRNQPIQAVLFDYGLVLSGPPDPAAWAEMQQILATPDPAFHDAYWRYRHDYDRGALSGPAYWNQVAADLGRTLTAQQTTDLLSADIALWTQPNQPMIDWAAQLQAAGVRTGILSNIGDAMETGILERLTWMHDFHHHTFSHRLNTAKPDPSIYAHAAEGLGVPPSQILFIDDREENIAAARAAGMQAIQYLNQAQFLADMHLAHLETLLTSHPNVSATHAAPNL
jgi:putative hydrolase of the HAD superfamily